MNNSHYLYTINKTQTIMRAAIYGAGSLGTILGAYITKNGGKVELINRNKAHVEALQKQGAKVTGTVEFSQPVTAYTPDKMSGTYDIIFLMTKQQQNGEVVNSIKEFLAPDGVIVTLQNGIPELQIGEIVGEERVLGCTVAWGATMTGPGVCELLERIRETGSIQAAAAGMELSYTKAWKILNRAEEELGTSLITRVSGGRNGGSSTLTSAGEEAVKDFREMEKKLAAYADELLETHWHPFRTDGQEG